MIGAVDIGGTKIAAGIVDPDGRVLARAQVPTNAEAGYPRAIDATVLMLQNAERITGQKIIGIGIGSTGPVYPMTGEIGDVNFFPDWKGENPVKDLEAAFQVSVAIENDADAAALGEAGWGAGRNKTHLIYVTVGTGIGVGDPSGPSCYCGFRGCWESLATGPAMEGWMAGNIPVDYPHRENLTAKKICELAHAGDEWAKRAVEREARYLGLGLANLVTLYVPDAIVLGGSVMKSADLFLDTVREIIAGSCRFVPWERTELALASLGEEANLIGAARVWYHRFAPVGGANAG